MLPSLAGQVCHSVAVETPESADEEEDPLSVVLSLERGGGWNSERLGIKGFRVWLRDQEFGIQGLEVPWCLRNRVQNRFLPRVLSDKVCMQSRPGAESDNSRTTFTCAET